jgi:hypothetical protein
VVDEVHGDGGWQILHHSSSSCVRAKVWILIIATTKNKEES